MKLGSDVQDSFGSKLLNIAHFMIHFLLHFHLELSWDVWSFSSHHCRFAEQTSACGLDDAAAGRG